MRKRNPAALSLGTIAFELVIELCGSHRHCYRKLPQLLAIRSHREACGMREADQNVGRGHTDADTI